MNSTLIKVGVIVACLLGSQRTAISEDAPALVATGAILSVQGNDSRFLRAFGIAPPLWSPTVGEVKSLELKLKSYLLHASSVDLRIVKEARIVAANLDEYKRQYVGYISRGRRWILVNALCREEWTRDQTWKNQLVVIQDGGRCYFHVRYSPSSRRFRNLWINGQA